MKRKNIQTFKWLLPVLIISLITVGYFLVQYFRLPDLRTRRVIAWIRNPQHHQDWVHPSLSRCRENTPFLFPTRGYIGYLWGDSFRPGHTHQGIDIFAGTASGETPIYAAYDGYLTRMPDWKSSLIIRVPADPLAPERQIWLYYTHLAGPDGNSLIEDNFPPGSSEIPLSEGTLLGYQGNYSGKPGQPVGVHLHFSIVKDDGRGQYLNELDIQNTLDPSPYFDLPLNASQNADQIPSCR